MRSSDVIIIGAGQAGLATSHSLSRRGIEHVVIDRGRIAERWRSERWDSLRLLTPNWQARLPGYSYRGSLPDGFMSMPQVVAYLEGYARYSAAPIVTQTRVLRVSPVDAGYRVDTDRGPFRASNVVLATGHCDVARRPQFANALSRRVHQLDPSAYRNPESLPHGGVLVVGASASGVQIADELAHSGRDVVLAVGRHTRLPRRYRGADIMTWLECIGALDETAATVRDLEAARHQPSLQLVGSDPPRDIDLSTLQQRGVRIAGRVTAMAGEHVLFGSELASSVQHAEHKLARVLGRIDRYIDDHAGLGCGHGSSARPRPIAVTAWPRTGHVELAAENLSTVIWATGFRRDYSWLAVPVLGADREIVHARGITQAAGLYAMGLHFQHTRKSSFIDGVGADAEYIARAIAARLGIRESFAA